MKTQVKQVLFYLPASIGLILIIYFIVTTILTQLFVMGTFSFDSFNGESTFLPLFFIVLSRMLIEFWVLFVVMTALTVAIPFGTITVIWILGSIFLIGAFFSGMGIMMKLRDKNSRSFWKLPWLHIAFLVWILNVLVFVPKDTVNIQWQMEYTNLSRQVEQRQFGPFFWFFEYFNQMETIISYRVEQQADGKIIMQQSRRLLFQGGEDVSAYELAIQGLDDDFTLRKTQKKPIRQEYDGGKKFAERHEELDARVTCIVHPDYQGVQKLCQELRFNGITVFKTKGHGVRVIRVVHNEKNNVLLIHFSSYFSDAEHVSIVKLS